MALEGIWVLMNTSRGSPREVFISTKGIYFCSLSKQQQQQLTMEIARLAPGGVGQDHVRTIIAESAFPVAYIWSLIEFCVCDH